MYLFSDICMLLTAGPTCGVCQTGWVMGTNGICTFCGSASAESSKNVALVFVSFAAIYVWYRAVWAPFVQQDPTKIGAQRGLLDLLPESLLPVKTMLLSATKVLREYAKKLKEIPDRLQHILINQVFKTDLPLLGFGKVIIGFFQVLSSYMKTFDIQWPSNLGSLFSLSANVNIDFFKMPGLSCSTKTFDYKSNFMFNMIYPLGVLLVLAVPFIIVRFFLGGEAHPKYNAVLNAFLFSTMCW
jgi:hypothetical protein